MSVISEVIRIENNNTLSFGNYNIKEKQKIDNFKFGNSTYKVKTHSEVTRIEKDGTLLLETVPGATIHNFDENKEELTFSIEGLEDTSVIVELESDTLYRVTVNEHNIGSMKSNLSGKINFSLNLGTGSSQDIEIKKV